METRKKPIANPFRSKYPKIKDESILDKQAARIVSLSTNNQILKSHIEHLRKKIDEQNRQIELYSDLLVKMEEKDTSFKYKINLN